MKLLIVLLSLVGCGKPKSILKFSDESSGGTVTKIETDKEWVNVEQKLLKVSCTKCHNPDTAKKRNRIDLTKRDLVLENYDDIIYRMTEAFDLGMDYMPPKGGAVKTELIQLLKDWKNNQK